MAAVVASLGSGPRPVARDRARIERQIRELAPVDGDPVRDRRQHATPTDAC
jgi:hypothetical protein